MSHSYEKYDKARLLFKITWLLMLTWFKTKVLD